jgi:hypothetical protein
MPGSVLGAHFEAISRAFHDRFTTMSALPGACPGITLNRVPLTKACTSMIRAFARRWPTTPRKPRGGR